MEPAPKKKIRYIAAFVSSGWPFLLTPASALAGDWTVVPRISAQELYTDNVLLTPTQRRSDFVSTLSPGLSVTGEGPRFQLTFDYAPTLQLYALTPDLDFFGQNLYANGTAALVPDLFFVDARGLLSLQPSNPALNTGLSVGAAPSLLGPNFVNVTQGIPKSQLAQVSSFSVSPYLLRRFGGAGTGEVRYTLTDTSLSGIQPTTSFTPIGTNLRNTDTVTNEATAVFITGENLGRLQSRVLLDAAESSGTTPSDQVIGTIDSGYAITRTVGVLTTIGYEHLHFGALPPTTIEDLVWGLGIKLNPNPDLTLSASYGHRNGFSAPSLSLMFNVTARTSLAVTYSEGLSTVSQDIANNLALSDLNQVGQTVDRRTLLPFLINNPALGLQTGLFRSKQLTATARTDFDRDHFTAIFNRNEQLLIAQTVAGLGVSQTLSQINFNWSRELSPRANSNLGIGYSESTFAAPANTETEVLSLSASISYQLNPTLTGWAGYNYFSRFSPQAQFRLSSNVISLGLRKEF
jgi:uncharacterized protein (PEP-CTERM system associated)